MARRRLVVLCGLIAVALLASIWFAIQEVTGGPDGAAAAAERESQRELIKKVGPPAELPARPGSGKTHYAPG
jgi:hypothetical protein